MSSLNAIYQSFLANPNVSALSSDASLNYITTLIAINSATSILKHIAAHHHVLKKKEENVLSVVESENSICLDVETTLEFVTGGGAYLPGLDDNFLADRVVTFPMVLLLIAYTHLFLLRISYLSRSISSTLTPQRKFKQSVFTGIKGLYSSLLTLLDLGRRIGQYVTVKTRRD